MPTSYGGDAKRRPDRDNDDDDEEADALILHRMSTDEHGRAIVSSIPAAQGTTRQARVTDPYDDLEEGGGDDDDDEYKYRDRNDGRLGKLPHRGTLEGSNPATQLDKTGRPAWFRGLLEGDVPALGLGGRNVGMSASKAQQNKRRRTRMCRLAALALAALLVIAVFSAALGPRIGLDVSKVYEYAGDKWYGDSGVMPYEFNKEIGWPGSYSAGKPPHFADEQTNPRLHASPTLGSSPIQTAVPGWDPKSKVKPFEHMGSFTPYRSSSGFGVDDAKYGGTPTASGSPAEGAGGSTCELQQVHILHRHGARYPTEHAPPVTVQNYLKENPNAKYSGPLSFLNSYTYRLGTELLTPVGRGQLYDSGVKAAILYGALAANDLKEKSKTGLPKKLFARAGSQQRIVDSGFAWLAGFWGQHWANSTNFEIQIESEGFNTTTAPEFACKAALTKPGMFPGGEAEMRWVEKYLADATMRLQRYVQGGAKLTPAIVYGMQSLCPFDTVAFGHSDFCSLFSADEWLGFEYAYDLKFQYSYGAPSRVGHAMGLGWVNELVARLTGEKWDRSTQTSENATLNLDDRTFPLDRRVYVDFTHDSTVTAVLSALDLPRFSAPIDKERRQDPRDFRTSDIVPFAARLVVEVWGCGAAVVAADADAHAAPGKEKWVRVKLNDAIVPLSQLKACEKREDGMCSLASFLESQKARNEHGWWDVCGETAD